jgi:integrase
MLLTQLSGTASVTGRCFTFGSRVDRGSLNWWDLIEDMMLQPQAGVLIQGKGRKERCLPLWKETASAVRAWLSVRGEVRVPELVLNARNDAMTRTGFECILRKHVHTAETQRDTFRRSLVSRHPPEWNRTNRRRISRRWLSLVPVFGNCIGMRRHLAAENMDRSVERVG